MLNLTFALLSAQQGSLEFGLRCARDAEPRDIIEMEPFIGDRADEYEH
jgi:hypothetical protein